MLMSGETGASGEMDEVTERMTDLNLAIGNDEPDAAVTRAIRTLRQRLADNRLNRQKIKQNIPIMECLIEAIKKIFPRKSLNVDISMSGSYYEKTKVSNPDEYDIMITTEFRAVPVYYPDTPSRCYCSLKLTSPGKLPPEVITVDNFVCPKAFARYFRQALASITLEGYTIDPLDYDGQSPAITLSIREEGKFKFSVDIVPAVRLLEWPQPAREWTSTWLPSKDIDRIKKPSESHINPCAVAKIHPTEYEVELGKCKLWRLSFSEPEKEILLYADGKHQQKQAEKKIKYCHKDILRLLKLDLVEFFAKYHKDRPQAEQSICSYYMKTVVLNLFERVPDPSKWCDNNHNLQQRYREAKELAVEYFKGRNIPHYFIADENLLSVKDIRKDELDGIVAFLLPW